MLRSTDYCKEYKNGNITIKYDLETIKEARKDETLIISDVLSWLDCYFIGDTYCLSNYETGHTLYNLHSDLIYIFLWRYLDDLMNGKTVRLYARKPDEYDRELLKEEGYSYEN